MWIYLGRIAAGGDYSCLTPQWQRTRVRRHLATYRLTDMQSECASANGAAQYPFPVNGCEVIGVEPDVKVSRTDAFGCGEKACRVSGPTSMIYGISDDASSQEARWL